MLDSSDETPDVNGHVVGVETRRQAMYVQLITFRLNGMSPAEFATLNDHVAPQYEGVRGLVSTIFLADPDDDHVYGGVYVWKTLADADVYTREGLAQLLVTSPDFADVEIRVFRVLPGPTAITGGPFAEVIGKTAA